MSIKPSLDLLLAHAIAPPKPVGSPFDSGGSPAGSIRSPVALRPRLATGLPLFAGALAHCPPIGGLMGAL